MTADLVKVRSDKPLGELLSDIADHPHPCIYVVNAEDRLKGFIVLSEIRRALENVQPMRPLCSPRTSPERISGP